MGKLIIGDDMKKRRKKRKKFFNKKYLYIFIIPLLFIVAYIEISSGIYVSGYFKDLLFYPTREIDSTEFLLSINKEIKEENIELKKMLNIQETLTGYDIVYATVVERNNSYWYDTVTINKGKNDGIEEKMAVVDSYGLVGTIELVSNNTSVIKLITNSDKYNEFSAKIAGISEINKIVSVSNNKLVIEGIDKNTKIKIGDKVVTNGLSNKFPSGILIGEIASFEEDYYGISNTAHIKLASNIDNLRFVAVLKRG